MLSVVPSNYLFPYHTSISEIQYLWMHFFWYLNGLNWFSINNFMCVSRPFYLFFSFGLKRLIVVHESRVAP